MSFLVASLLFVQGEIPHTFVYEAPRGLKSVHVAGTFNNWSPTADPMTLQADSMRWTATKRLAPGKHLYKFVLDGTEWITDPRSANDEDDGNGNTNSVLMLLKGGYEIAASRTDDRITESALYHGLYAPYFSYDRGNINLQLRARKNDVQSATVSIDGRTFYLKRTSEDDLHEWFRVQLPSQPDAQLEYEFTVVSGQKEFKYGPGGVGSGTRFRPGAEHFKALRVASWPETTIVYQIFPDRFANGDPRNDPPDVTPWDGTPTYRNFFGGDAIGIQRKIPYLKELGVGAIYFNPVFVSPSNHRYETVDYFKIDPRFGTNAEFAELTRELKKSGIRTVLDGVFNHTATTFGPFKDIIDQGESSQYKDWYFIKSYPVKVEDPPNYEAWWGFRSMPKVNLDNKGARDFMLSVPGYWHQNAEIAGWRLDVASEVSMPFWRDFRTTLKALDEEQWIVGEVWGDGGAWLKGDQWDSIMGYQFRDAVLKFVAEGKIGPSEFFSRLKRVHDSYAPAVSRNIMILLGSHDTPRIRTLCGGDEDLAMLAATLQLTWVGAPSIYYGDELGMEGDRDPDNRRGMDWSLVHDDNRVLTHYRVLLEARQNSKALRIGDPMMVYSNDAAKSLVYARVLGGDSALVAVNRSDKAVTLQFPVPPGLAEAYRNVFDNKTLTVDDAQIELKLPAKGSAVFLPAMTRS